jgi:hypothetical protein
MGREADANPVTIGADRLNGPPCLCDAPWHVDEIEAGQLVEHPRGCSRLPQCVDGHQRVGDIADEAGSARARMRDRNSSSLDNLRRVGVG